MLIIKCVLDSIPTFFHFQAFVSLHGLIYVNNYSLRSILQKSQPNENCSTKYLSNRNI